MKSLTLHRLTTGDTGTFGELILAGRKFYTGELPWRDLDHNGISDSSISCIPAGTYRAVASMSNRFQRVLYQLQGVPSRSSIRIHPANWMGDKSKGLKCELEGCIALGLAHGLKDGQEAVIDSRAAVNQFMSLLQNADFDLVVEAVPQVD